MKSLEIIVGNTSSGPFLTILQDGHKVHFGANALWEMGACLVEDFNGMHICRLGIEVTDCALISGLSKEAIIMANVKGDSITLARQILGQIHKAYRHFADHPEDLTFHKLSLKGCTTCR